ncbi:SDR family oxidoreductase [Candidatus Gottesmanbacteria bacterium]|nr:SDR family oxidoreductase [Candidatus Gottesmanbacteria bacterium]
MLTYLVTGGAGFIGSHLCEKLLSEESRVICIDNLITGRIENIKNLLSNPNFSFIKHDITKPLSNYKLPTTNYQLIFHLASPASPPQYQKYSIETLLTNSIGTKNILDIAIKNNAKILIASTSEVYGDPQIHPQPETYWGNVNPVGVRSCYDESKRFAESLTMEYIRKKNCRGIIVRIFNTYGPKMAKDDGRVVSNFCYSATHREPLLVYGDGTQTRSFCYISDMVEGLLKALQKGKIGQVYNIGNPDEKKVIELAKIIKKLANSHSQIKFEQKPEEDPTRRKPDIEKIKREIGWQPKVNLEDGLIKTIEYFRSIK